MLALCSSFVVIKEELYRKNLAATFTAVYIPSSSSRHED
jgi:hypothetical protein